MGHTYRKTGRNPYREIQKKRFADSKIVREYLSRESEKERRRIAKKERNYYLVISLIVVFMCIVAYIIA